MAKGGRKKFDKSNSNLLGKFKEVEFEELRKRHGFQEPNFSDWLERTENLNFLSRALGSEIELVNPKREEKVQGIKIDILCENAASPSEEGEFVIIENQIKKSDHDHLGKLLAYAAGQEATTCIWVATEFKSYHLTAINWLNKNTDEGIAFFAVEAKLYRIDTSKPVPVFKVLCGPEKENETLDTQMILDEKLPDFKKIAKSKKQNTSNKKIHRKYWIGLIDYLETHNFEPNIPAPATEHFQTFFSMKNRLVTEYALLKTKYKQITIEIYVRDKEMYKKLKRQSSKIKKEVEDNDSKLKWIDAAKDKKTSRIVLQKDIDNPKDENTWSEHFSWFKEKLEKMETAFRHRIDEIDV